MPWSIDGPSSTQLGYRRERRLDDELAPPPAQQKRPWVGIALLVALPALVALLLVLYLTDRPPQIDGKAPGTWREVGTPERYPLVLRKTGEAGVYDIHYPRMGDTQRAILKDDSIVVLKHRYGPEIRGTLTYDPESDQLTATSSAGTFKLERAP